MKMNKPTLNKEIWLQSKVWTLNILAEELNRCRQKLAIAQNVFINANLQLIYNSEAENIKVEFEEMSKNFYAEFLSVKHEWEKIKDE